MAADKNHVLIEALELLRGLLEGTEVAAIRPNEVKALSAEETTLSNVLDCATVDGSLTLSDELSTSPTVSFNVCVRGSSTFQLGFFAFHRRSDSAVSFEHDASKSASSSYARVFRIGNGHRFSEDSILKAIYGENVPSYELVLDLWSDRQNVEEVKYPLDVALLRAYLKKVCFGS